MAELLYGSPVDTRRLAADAGLPVRLAGALLDVDVVLMTLGQPEPEPEERTEQAAVVELRPRLA